MRLSTLEVYIPLEEIKNLSVLCCGIHGVCGFPDALANSRPAALVLTPAALAPCVCRRLCTILAALVAAFSSRCRRPCPLLAALAAFAAALSPVCRRCPRGLSTRPCSYTSRPRTVCLSPSAAPCRRSDEATFHQSPKSKRYVRLARDALSPLPKRYRQSRPI